jgi:hypothetical protein
MARSSGDRSQEDHALRATRRRRLMRLAQRLGFGSRNPVWVIGSTWVSYMCIGSNTEGEARDLCRTISETGGRPQHFWEGEGPGPGERGSAGAMQPLRTMRGRKTRFPPSLYYTTVVTRDYRSLLK